MLTTNKQRISQVYECVKAFHTLEVFPSELPNPQSPHLLPTLRPYQVNAVKWMLTKELYPSYYLSPQGGCSAAEIEVLLPKGGILAEEMGLGKTVEVLACVLSNPRTIDVKQELCAPVKVETVSVMNVGDENQPIEEGTVEIQSGDVKPNVDITFGVESLNSSGCLVDCVSELNVASSAGEQLNEDQQLKEKSKRKRRVKFDSTISPPSKKRKKDVEIKTGEIMKCFNDKGAPQPKSQRAAAVKAKGQVYAQLKAWYDDMLSESSVRTERTKRLQRQSTFQCCCIKDMVSDDIVECPKCGTWQHKECVGYDEDAADYEYFCFRCWKDLSPVVSAGTVIISPEAISQQWVSEIEKHVKKDKLKVLFYEGVRANGYIQPHDLASYDIVITTYQVLTRELNYTEPVTRHLRHAKRFFAPTSPLLFVQWWRLCLDEAQMVEGSACRAAEMAKKFSAINKWAVTGTPIQKAVNDLVGLMEFLAGTEYPEFLALMGRDWRSLLKLVPRVLWRTQMKDVLAETGVPPQTVDTHSLQFSKIEKYFYQCTHTECSNQFVNRIMGFGDLNVTLKSLDRKVISNLLNPLLKLRQACFHPQAVRGKFVSIKKTMTMDDLVGQMVINAKLEAELAMRQLVASLNGQAALHIIREEWLEAVTAYRTVLHLEQEHRGRLKIDSLQKIHAMHNLAEVLDGCHEGIPPTLRDSTLREDVKALELRYLGAREALISATQERVDQCKRAVANLLKGSSCGGTLSYSEWWIHLLEWLSVVVDREELLDRLVAAIKLTDDKQKNQYNNLANKLKSLYIVRMELANWLAELDRTREKVRKWLKTLRQEDTDLLAAEALDCHLPQATGNRSKTRCQLCRAESVLKCYEALLFEEKGKAKRKPRKNLPGSSDWKTNKDLDNKEISELVDVNVNTFESSKKGGFKPSPQEKLLRALAKEGRLKQASVTWTKQAREHFTLLDRLKKEFLDMNLLWRQVSDLVDAKDELNMCKTRLRLPYPNEEVLDKKKKVVENFHIISAFRVEPELHKLLGETTQYEALLKKKCGTLFYLENLEKEGAPAAICPICRNDLTDKWSVLQCGHCMCLECLSVVIKPNSSMLQCPQCRQPCSRADISYVEHQAVAADAEPGTSKTPPVAQPIVSGSHSTKVTALLSQTMRLIAQQPDIKILVFSTWDKVLDLLAEAFEGNKITFRRLKSSKKQKQRDIKEFKNGEVTVLLLPLRSGAKGLNLVEATHVFLVEPILNSAEELQAVGRVHRIGQTRPTVVHRFIVQETIEERILEAVAASGADQWSDDCVTLQQLFDLFSNNDFSLSLSQPEPSSVNIDSSSDSDHDKEPDTLLHLESDDDGDEL